MSMTDHRPDGPMGPELEELAAEYVLGTLGGPERAAVSARLDLDAELAAAVARWEAKLAPLGEAVAEVAAPASVWAAVERRIGAAPGAKPANDVAPPATAPNVAGWRAYAIAATVAALALGGLFAREKLAFQPPAPEPLVAMLSGDGKAPGFLLSVDVVKRELTIRRVGAEATPDRSHELWIVSDKLGKPVSLGLVGDRGAAATLAKYDPATFEAATYAISLEPAGGSKTGQPTGPVVFSGKLTEMPR